MEKYSIEFKKSAVKELKYIPNKDVKRIIQNIALLADEPRPENSKKLSASEKYRIRIGDYRFLYEIQDNKLIIYIVMIAHRKEVY
jgi:mRNA interferase RelE/StbE